MLNDIDLHRSLRLALDAMAFETATPVQARVVPAALSGTDVHVTAETGSGKTLAYLIPAIQRIFNTLDKRTSGTLVLVLVPTRELARQVLKEARQLLKHSKLSAAGITGGADFKYQRALLRKDPEIVIGTPGRILEHCQKNSMTLEGLQTLVLDEADRMLDLGFRDDVTDVTKRTPPQYQKLLLSATPGHGGVQQMAKALLHNPQIVTLNAPRQPHSTITHQVILADSDSHKDKLITALAGMPDYQRLLVFANKRVTAVRLTQLLSEDGVRCAALHGEMRTEERKHVIAQIHDNKIDVLCASDVAARGLDIKAIDCVVNYDLPRAGDDYLHRTGRTGRAGESGLAISFVTAADWNLMISISRYLGMDFERRSLPGLKARFNGPKKKKSDGRAAGKKKKRNARSSGKPSKPKKTKQSAKSKKTGPVTSATNDGFAPLRKKPKR